MVRNPLDQLLNRNLKGGNNNSIINRGINTTNSQMYFINVDTGGRLEIQFVPSDIQHDRKGKWATADIIGRNTPKYQYINGETVLSFTLDFYADEESRTSTMRKVAWLHSLIANDGYRKKTPRVILVMGDMFKKDVWIVESAPASYENLSRPHGFLPQQAYVDITLKLDPNFNLAWSDIKRPFVQAASDGANPISLGKSGQLMNLGDTGRSNIINGVPHTRPYLGQRESDDPDVSYGNNWKQILLRTIQRFRIPGSMDGVLLGSLETTGNLPSVLQ